MNIEFLYPLTQCQLLVKAAFISAEDKNFYTHAGYDPAGMASALRDAVRSRGKRSSWSFDNNPTGYEKLFT